MSICGIFYPPLTFFVIHCFVLTGRKRVACDLSKESQSGAPVTCMCIHHGEIQRSPFSEHHTRELHSINAAKQEITG